VNSEGQQVWRTDRETSQRQAVDKWTVRALLEPAGLPWTTLRVAHRAHLRPQAPQPSTTCS